MSVLKPGRWGTEPGENLALMGEAEYPSQVDDRIRTIAAAVARWLRDAQWTDYAEAFTQGSNAFTVDGDLSDLYFVGRNVRATVAGLPVYATVDSVSYNPTSDETFVGVTVGEGETIAGASEIALETIPREEEAASAIPSGTRMLFYQATAPSGWTQVTDVNDRMLRVVSGEGAATGGNWTISGVTNSTTTLTEDQIPQHYHYMFVEEGSNYEGYALSGANKEKHVADNASGSGDNDYTTSVPPTNTGAPTAGRTGSAGGGEAPEGHSHTVSADGEWRPAYIDVIVCEKD